jgi:hypothetical protein
MNGALQRRICKGLKVCAMASSISVAENGIGDVKVMSRERCYAWATAASGGRRGKNVAPQQ